MALKKKLTGRVKYDRKLIIPEVCRRISLGETLTAICQDDHICCHPTWCAWMLEDKSAADEYLRARESRADARADRIDEYTARMLRGEIDPQQCRVAVDTEKWQAAHEQPKRYGDKLDINHGGKIEIDQSQRDAAVAAALAHTGTIFREK